MLQPLVGGLPAHGAVGSLFVVEVLPLLEFVVEQTGIVNHDAVQEAVELFGVDPVGSLHLPVVAGCGGVNLDVVDALVDEVPIEGGLELGFVVSWTFSTRKVSRART